MRTQIRRRSISDFSFTPIVAALAAVLTPQAASAMNIVVNSNSDLSIQDTEGDNFSLRGAIDFLNTVVVDEVLGPSMPNCSGSDTITFASPFVIAVSTEMDLHCPGVTINGSGSRTNSVTKLFGYGGGSGTYMINALSSPNAQIVGLDIGGWTYGGATAAIGGFVDASGNIIHDNVAGISVANGHFTIHDNAIVNNTAGSGNGISATGSSVDIYSNFIYGNGENGIQLSSNTGSRISGNTIGLDESGEESPNGNFGVYIQGGSSSITIGPSPIGGQNIISANGSHSEGDFGGGIYIYGSSGIAVAGNMIGADSTGKISHPNVDGVTARCSDHVSITNNVIAAFNDHGIRFGGVAGGGSMDIAGNHINIAGDGVTALGGSNAYGVVLGSYDCTSSATTNVELNGNTISNTTIGVLLTGASNTVIDGNNDISDNAGDGIFIFQSNHTSITGNTINDNSGNGVNIDNTSTGNSIIDNRSISGNELKNVNLASPGAVYRTNSFVLDTAHANDGLSAPSITRAVRNFATNQTDVTVTLSAPPGSYQLQVCDNADLTPACNHVSAAASPIVGVGTPGTFIVHLNTMTLDNFSANVTNSGTNDSSEYSEGVAVTPTPYMTFSPSSQRLDFSNVAVGATSAALSIRLTSSGSAPYSIGDIESPVCYGGAICSGGPFTCTKDIACNSPLNPTSYCTITATFNPTSVGSFSQTIGVCDNAPGGGAPGRTITLAGNGVIPPPISFNPSSFDFGTVSIGTQGTPQAFTLFNVSATTIPLGVPALDDVDFVFVDSTCSTNLAPHTGCEIDVAFAPQSGGIIHGSLIMPAGVAPDSLQIKRVNHGKVLTDSAGLGATALLTGTGTRQGIVSLPAAVDLGTFTVGGSADTKIVTITNSGNAPVNFSSITVTGPFSIVNGCTSSLQPDASCSIILSYSSPILGDNTGTLVVLSDATGGTGTIRLTGKSVPNPIPIISVTPAQIGFGDRLLGSSSNTQRITISNIGNATGTISLGMSNTDFVISNTTCTLTLAAGSSCYADVALRPVGFGPRTGSFIVTSNATGSPFSTTLAGTGCRPYSAGSSRLGSSFGCSP